MGHLAFLFRAAKEKQKDLSIIERYSSLLIPVQLSLVSTSSEQ